MAQIHEHLGVVILAAGASVRMARPKLLLPWRDTTVIGQLIAQWREIGARQIAVVHRSNDAALAEELDRLNFPKSNRIENPQPERGMFSSVVCAANWAGWREEIHHWAIMLGDQPHLKTETIRRLVEFSGQNLGEICQPVFAGHGGHPVILPQTAFSVLKCSLETTLKDFLNLAPAPRVQFAVTDTGVALDLDTPEDYKRLTISH